MAALNSTRTTSNELPTSAPTTFVRIAQGEEEDRRALAQLDAHLAARLASLQALKDLCSDPRALGDALGGLSDEEFATLQFEASILADAREECEFMGEDA